MPSLEWAAALTQIMPVTSRSDPQPAHRRLAADDQLKTLQERHGYLVVEPAAEPFARLIKAIGRQQVSMESAAATWERLTERFSVTPESLREADLDALQDVGLSTTKSEAVRAAARRFDEAGWTRSSFADRSTDAVQATLTEIHGIGPWTAKMFLIFGLGRDDVFPVEDLGIRQAMTAHFDVETRAEMRSRAAQWAPDRSLASVYLWRAIEQGNA
jgi:DNA-3-methyladenine glycosylase II